MVERRGFVDVSQARASALQHDILMEKKEEEVKLAEMEVHIRQMVMDVCQPTVERSIKLQNRCEHLEENLRLQNDWLKRITEDVHHTKEQIDVVGHFRVQMDEFWKIQTELEVKLAKHTKDILSQVEETQATCTGLISTTQRLRTSMDRHNEDSGHLRNDITKNQQHLDLGIKKVKEFLDSEVRRVDFSINQVKAMHNALSVEIWGPQEPEDLSPPSLRRLDMQVRQLQQTTREVLAELNQLRLLDAQVQKVTSVQAEHGSRITDLETDLSKLTDDVDTLAKDTKHEIKQTANMMASFSATLMHDIRGSFSQEVQQLQDIHQNVQKFLRETEESVHGLKEALQSSGRYLESTMREVRTDLDGIESRRKRDKLGLESIVNTLRSQVTATSDSTDKIVSGLEHVSSVIAMCLQSQRMTIALEVQDYADRKDKQYIAIMGRKGDAPAKVENLGQLRSIPYQPTAIVFQGTSFERPQLLSLTEKLVFTAQEALLKGPGAKQFLSRPGSRDPFSTFAGDAFNREYAQVQARQLAARPGSRGQPSARGSPTLSGEANDRFPSKDDWLRPLTTSTAKPFTADSSMSFDRLSTPCTSIGPGNSTRLPALPSISSDQMFTRSLDDNSLIAGDSINSRSAPLTAR